MYLLDEKGFSLIQTLIAFTIVILLVMSITPSIIFIKKEQDVLKQRLKNAHYLHDVLIEELHEKKAKNKSSITNNLQYKVVYQKELIKVCGTWTNIKEVQENRCYYGKKEGV